MLPTKTGFIGLGLLAAMLVFLPCFVFPSSQGKPHATRHTLPVLSQEARENNARAVAE
jgi:hypothetical protein